jgi:opacity protein-like surface antigen
MKKLLFYLVLFLSSTCFSQAVRGYGGVGAYMNRSFDKSTFISFDAGLECKITKILKPEIEFQYFLGAVPDRTTENASGVTTELLARSVYATNLSISPKISFGLEGDHVHFQLLPKYNFTRVVATGSLFTANNTNTEFIKTDSDKYSETRHSLGIGIGVLFDLTDDTFQSIALNLYYNNIDIGNAVTKLKFSNGSFHSQQSLGIGLQYYFGFSKKK